MRSSQKFIVWDAKKLHGTLRVSTRSHHFNKFIMPNSSVNSPDEDTELPDAPQSPLGEPSSDTDSLLPKPEPQPDPTKLPAPHVKKEIKEEVKEIKKEIKVEDLFSDEDEDFLGDDDGADLLASEFKVVMYGILHLRRQPLLNRNELTDLCSPVDVKPSSRVADPEVMLAFYQRLFPFRYLFQWLNHSPVPSNDFGHREFAFTLQNDAYLRYQAFPTFET